MNNLGLFVVFESAPKCGKTTLATEVVKSLQIELNTTVEHKRGALSNTPFASEIKSRKITDLGYSSAFYWADCIFDTQDFIRPTILKGNIIIQERYDLSIATFREIHGFQHDELLLDNYLQHGMLIHPDLTIFLRPDPELIVKRISSHNKSTDIDKMFIKNPLLINSMQTRLEHHIKRLHRKYLVIDTGKNNINTCISIIMDSIQSIRE